MKRFAALLLIIFIVSACGMLDRRSPYAFSRTGPTELAYPGDYKHSRTNLVFPDSLFGIEREIIYSFGSMRKDISATYSLDDGKKFTVFTIYIYPNDRKDDESLINDFSLGLLAMVSRSQRTAAQVSEPEAIVCEEDGYKTIGLYAVAPLGFRMKTSLTAFRCGKWFLEFRITTDNLEENYIESLRDSLITKFNPVDVIKKDPVEPGAEISFSSYAINDSLLFGAAQVQSSAALEWMDTNVDSLERCSGFPELYIEFKSEPMRKMVEWYNENKNKYPENGYKHKYPAAIKKIVESGYINEFLMEQYNNVFIHKADGSKVQCREEEYKKWKEENLPDFKLGEDDKLVTLKFPG